MSTLIHLNHVLIDQALDLISAMPPSVYKRSCAEVFSSSIGQHMRHCIEHYDELLMANAVERVVAYQARPRNVEVETHSSVAVSRLRFIRNQLERIGTENRPLEVSDGGLQAPLMSCLFRELEFLISHTVHHFALIAVIANKFQINVPDNFGIALSTLQHRGSI